MILSWNTTNACNMYYDDSYRTKKQQTVDIEGDVRKTPFDEIWRDHEVLKTHDGDYMAEEPWCLYQGRKGI